MHKHHLFQEADTHPYYNGTLCPRSGTDRPACQHALMLLMQRLCKLERRSDHAGACSARGITSLPEPVLCKAALQSSAQETVHDDIRVAPDGGREVGVLGNRQRIVPPVLTHLNVSRAEVPRHLQCSFNTVSSSGTSISPQVLHVSCQRTKPPGSCIAGRI